MYAVVGCRDCETLWIVEDRPETTQCPSCRTRYQFDRLRAFAEAEDVEAARNARTRLLAERSAGEDVADELPAFETMEAAALDAGPSDETYLEGSGIDPGVVADADDSPAAASSSPRAIVEDAIHAAEPPTEDRILARAAERDLSGETARELLEKLVRSGEASVTDGRYRLL